MKVILASASPRRKELLSLLVPDFRICPAEVDESAIKAESPSLLVRTLARQKALAVAKNNPDALVIGADTVVAMGQTVFGKPRDERDAKNMLRALSGKTHQVYTGVFLKAPQRSGSFVAMTDVSFYPLKEDTIDWYLHTGEPFDKAGGYGIQGLGARLVRSIRGDFYNVVGLPVAKMQNFLEKMTINL